MNKKHTQMLAIYTAQNGTIKVEARLENETMWLNQAQIAEIFGVNRQAITKHIRNIYDSEELDKKEVCSILELTTIHGAIKGKRLQIYCVTSLKDIRLMMAISALVHLCLFYS